MTLGETNSAIRRVVYFRVSPTEVPTVNSQELYGKINIKKYQPNMNQPYPGARCSGKGNYRQSDQGFSTARVITSSKINVLQADVFT